MPVRLLTNPDFAFLHMSSIPPNWLWKTLSLSQVELSTQENSLSVPSSLPYQECGAWRGGVTGSNLGQHCFQFCFELEEDILEVLANRPYHHNKWMVILQRWEPVISPMFPSHIPFWIRLQGIPLHFWQQKMIYNIGQELGTLED